MPSIVSGLPARPIDDDPPAGDPDARVGARRAPGRATSPPTIASSTPPRSARTPSPSRIVLPKPGRIRSGPPASSASGTSQRSVSASRTAPGSGTAVPPLARQRQRGLARAGASSGPSARPPWPRITRAPPNGTRKTSRGLPGSKKTLAPGRDREPHAPGRGAVEAQRAVDLEEVEVRRDADRDLALVDDRQRALPREPLERRPPRARAARTEPIGSCSTSSRLPSANSASTSTRRTSAGDAVEHVGGPERRVAGGLGLGVGAAVARGLADLVGDQRDGLGLVEPQPAPAPPARQLGGQEEQQAVLLAREEAHRRRQSLTRAPRTERSLRPRGHPGAHPARPARGRRARRRRPARELRARRPG